MKKNLQLAVIVPVFNEENNLENMAADLGPHLDYSIGTGKWRFVFVDNGSKDNTKIICYNIIKRWPDSSYLHLDKPDYGEALFAGLTNAKTPFAYIINVDFWDPIYLHWSWHHRKNYDVIIGSKRSDFTIYRQPRYRLILSWGLNTVLQF